MGRKTHGLARNYKTDKEARDAYEKYRRSTPEHKKWSEEYRKKKKEELAKKKKIYHQSDSYKRIEKIRRLENKVKKLERRLEEEIKKNEILELEIKLKELKNVK